MEKKDVFGWEKDPLYLWKVALSFHFEFLSSNKNSTTCYGGLWKIIAWEGSTKGMRKEYKNRMKKYEMLIGVLE
ncbi:unnamed protein product [Dovyalis caffra]|uniref:Uncharacterized protein n=1 Tax=Dovyalis caffra TaxID=77055 RepID=A0AAV1RCC2_9ROSI|nr:unnamed protein product [Dovyalis caffra]